MKTETSTVDRRWSCFDERHKTRYEAFDTPMFTYPAKDLEEILDLLG